MTTPSPNGDNGPLDPAETPRAGRSQTSPTKGRDGRGRFAAGNPGGPGNPMAVQVGQLRAALLGAVKPADMKAIAAKLVQMAREGHIPAIREVLERTLGKPIEADLLDRIGRLEALLAEKENLP